MEILVNELLEQNLTGAKFFEELTGRLSTDDVFNGLYAMVKDPFRYTFILSGIWGQQFLNWLIRTSKTPAGYIVFPGGMRDGVQRAHSYINVRGPWNTGKVAFVAPTIYSGVERDTCCQRLQIAKPPETIVAYDGAPVELPNCRSLYRYYDHYDSTGHLVAALEG